MTPRLVRTKARNRRSSTGDDRNRAKRRIGGLIIGGGALAATVIASIVVIVGNRIGPEELRRVPAVRSPISLRLSGPLDVGMAGPVVAWRMGLFEREGVTTNLTSEAGDAAVLEKVSAETGAIGLVRSDAFLVARERGLPIVAFAAGYLETPVVFVAGGQGKISRPQDFVGKRVGYRSDGDASLIYEGLLAKLQIPRNLINETPASTEPAALLDGSLDVWPGRIGDGVSLLCPASRPCNVIRPADFGLHVPGSVYFSSETTLRERPEDLRRFLRALVAGWEVAVNGGDQVKQVLESALEVQPRTSVATSLIEQQEAIRPLGTRFGEYDEEGWRKLRDLMVASKVLANPVDLSKAVSFSFIAELYRRPLGSDD